MEKYAGWSCIGFGVVTSSVLIYINNLPNGTESICKIFPNDASPFSKVEDKILSNIQLNND